MRALFTAALTMLLATTATLAAVKTEKVEYAIGDTKFVGLLAYDDAATAPRPGVLVCHEWWGNNAYAAKRATMLAELGYVAFALDMYGNGQTTIDPKVAGEWAGKMYADPAAARQRAAAGLKVLAQSKHTDPTRLAAIGYCMGGTVALELARSGLPHTEHLRAIVPFHASTIAAKNADDNKNIKGAVLVCHGVDDGFVQPQQITDFHAQMKAAAIDYEFLSLGNSVHSFTNPDADSFKIDGVKYNAAADRRSWSAMLALFTEAFAAKPAAAAPAKPAAETKPAAAPSDMNK